MLSFQQHLNLFQKLRILRKSLKGFHLKRQVVLRGKERQTMDSENPIDDLKKLVPFRQGPDDSQEESELRTSLLESIVSTDMNRSLRERIRRSLAGVPLWRRPRLVVPSFAAMTIMSVLIISTTTSPSALAQVNEATENSVNANSGVSTTFFEIVDPETKEVKYSEETVFIYEEEAAKVGFEIPERPIIRQVFVSETMDQAEETPVSMRQCPHKAPSFVGYI